MLSAVYTPKFAMFWEQHWLGCHAVSQRQIFKYLSSGYKCFPALQKRALVKTVLHMKCNLDKYSKLIGLYFSLIFKVYFFPDNLIAVLYLH